LQLTDIRLSRNRTRGHVRNLGAAPLAGGYARAGVTMPGIDGPGAAPVRIPATHVTFGLSIVADAPNRQHAEAFLALFLSPEGVALRHAGPAPNDPARVDAADLNRVPAVPRPLLRAQAMPQ
jgi:molybdate/tungstate transport system substrate-binding protein